MNQITEKISTAENFMRSAKAPTISAPVMPAKVAWKAMKANSGSFTVSVKVSASVSIVTPDRKTLSSEPMKGLASVKVRL